jgi:hypothetical protein
MRSAEDFDAVRQLIAAGMVALYRKAATARLDGFIGPKG